MVNSRVVDHGLVAARVLAERPGGHIRGKTTGTGKQKQKRRLREDEGLDTVKTTLPGTVLYGDS